MDVGLHGIAQSVVDHTVARKTPVPDEARRDERHPKVSAASGGAGVATVEVTLVLDFQVLRLEVRAQGRLDPGRALARWDHAPSPRS